jgi:hypothetical protein
MGQCLLPGSLLFYFRQLMPRVNFVGISVGIGDDRRQKYFYIQMVMVVSGDRPGAGHGNASQENSSCLFAISATGIEPPTLAGIE